MRAHLERYLAWLHDEVLPGFIAVNHKQDVINNTKQQIANIHWQLATPIPRPAPTCGWKKSYQEHGENCPKHDKRCQDKFDRWRAEIENASEAP